MTEGVEAIDICLSGRIIEGNPAAASRFHEGLSFKTSGKKRYRGTLVANYPFSDAVRCLLSLLRYQRDVIPEIVPVSRVERVSSSGRIN